MQETFFEKGGDEGKSQQAMERGGEINRVIVRGTVGGQAAERGKRGEEKRNSTRSSP